jgi:hypothetical protein
LISFYGVINTKVYKPLPKTLDELKENIKSEIGKISKDILNSTFLNFKKRCESVISAGGGHIEFFQD